MFRQIVHKTATYCRNIEILTSLNSDLRPDQWDWINTMVLKLDGNSEIGANVWDEFGNLSLFSAYLCNMIWVTILH